MGSDERTPKGSHPHSPLERCYRGWSLFSETLTEEDPWDGLETQGHFHANNKPGWKFEAHVLVRTP